MKNAAATVESRVRSILEEELGVETIGVGETLEQAGLDSLDRCELWIKLEEEFGLPETDDDVEDECETVWQIVAYVERKKAQ